MDDENTMAVGMTRAISEASCSAPDGRAKRWPSTASTASAAASTSAGWKGMGGMRQIGSHAASQPSASAASPAAARAPASMAARASGSMWRRSRVRRVSPGTAVTTPGLHSTQPTVATPSWARATSATARAKRAAAAKLSRRRRMGVVPAWAAWPVSTRRSRSMPTVPVTTPIPSPRSSSTGPCSMWTST